MPYVRATDAEIYYEEVGRGEPLLLIMGFGGTHHAWMAQLPMFRRRYRAITYDSRGLGRSRDSGEPYRFVTLANDAVAILDHLGVDRSHVLGYSLGGAVAQEVAINSPDRVAKLVLGATLSQGRRAELTPEMRRALDIALDADLDTVVADIGQLDLSRLMPLIVRRSFENPFARWWLSTMSRRVSTVISDAGLRRQAIAAAEIDTLDRLHLVRAPTLVITGTRDRLVPPRFSEEIAERIPDARLVLVRGASHAMAIERAWRFNREVLRFLNDA
jgi:pimeloyl-ACP methyl ester carboxylesterase